MPEIILTRDTGAVPSIEALGAKSLVDEQLGLGTGCCTSRAWIDGDFLLRLAPLSPQEDDLPGPASHPEANSRLSCQILLPVALDGLRLTLRPLDRTPFTEPTGDKH